MGKNYYRSGKLTGFQFDEKGAPVQNKADANGVHKNKRDDDLVIEDNTIYEIDRECYERSRRQKRR